MLKITVEILVISYPVYKYVCTSDDVVNVHVHVFHNSYFQYSRTSLPPARYNLNGRETDTFGKCVRLRSFSIRYDPTSFVVSKSYWFVENGYGNTIFFGKRMERTISTVFSSRSIVYFPFVTVVCTNSTVSLHVDTPKAGCN